MPMYLKGGGIGSITWLTLSEKPSEFNAGMIKAVDVDDSLKSDGRILKYDDEAKKFVFVDESTGTNFDGQYSSLTGTPTIPTALSQLSDDSQHRTVTDIEKSSWGDKASKEIIFNEIPGVPQEAYFYDNFEESKTEDILKGGIINGTYPTLGVGKFGNAINVQSGTDYSITLNDIVLNTSYTIEFWFVLTGSTAFYLYLPNIRFYIAKDKIDIYYFGQSTCSRISNLNLPDNIWKHIAITITDHSLELFLDGNSIHKNTNTGNTLSGSKAIKFQSNYNTRVRRIDDLLISKGVKYTDNFPVPTTPYNYTAERVFYPDTAKNSKLFDGKNISHFAKESDLQELLQRVQTLENT